MYLVNKNIKQFKMNEVFSQQILLKRSIFLAYFSNKLVFDFNKKKWRDRYFSINSSSITDYETLIGLSKSRTFHQ